jgi:hypothetical protein
MTPPSIDHPTANDAWQFGKIGLAFRGLGKKDEYRLLRWGPMAVADLVAEWFDTEVLRATVAARGSLVRLLDRGPQEPVWACYCKRRSIRIRSRRPSSQKVAWVV